MNDYEAKQEARRERLTKAAASERATAEGAWARSSALTGQIPMGQPILVGHHSEKRHRRAIERSQAAMRKAVKASKAADDLGRRAAAVGTGGVSSDDPDAIVKLTAELDEARADHAKAKRANAAWRKHMDNPVALRDALTALGYGREELAQQARTMSLCAHLDAPFILPNLAARAKRIEKRLAELSKPAPTFETIEGTTPDGVAFTIAARPELNRIAITCEGGRLSDAAYRALKSAGWRWSPTESAFLRHLNNAGIYAAKCAAVALGASS